MVNPLKNHKVLGVVFLALLLSGVWASYGVFTQKFTDFDEVELKTSNIGLQLPIRADVKIRGVQVGEVTDIKAEADGATLTLGLYPDMRDTIPGNVTGSIVPKTLFGEKYVSLIVPEGPIADAIEVDAVIDRTDVSTEVEQVLNDLYPLLRAVQPAEINMTLNAIATALEGRGDQLGNNLETIDSYLKRLNPEIPALVEDLRLTGEVSDVYADVLPRSPRSCATRSPRRRRSRVARRSSPRSSRTSARSPRRPSGSSTTTATTSSVSVRSAATSWRSSPATRPSIRACSTASCAPASSRPRPSVASPCTSSSRPCPTSRAATGHRTSRSTATSAAPTAAACPTHPGTRTTP